MAAITAMPKAAEAAAQPPTPSDGPHDMQEYYKIVQFRDRILSGSHPRIKPPPPSLGKQSSPQSTSLPSRSAPRPAHGTAPPVAGGRQKGNIPSVKTNPQQPAAARAPAATSAADASAPKPFASAAPEIDPLLLTKSDELLRAELQLKRQRLEKSLRDELEQRKGSKANSLAAEQFSGPDLSDVLAKALTLVQATAPPVPADANGAANASQASDSFDENTFYSSQHDTPEPRISPRAHIASLDVPAQDPSLARAPTSPRGAVPRAVVPGLTASRPVEAGPSRSAPEGPGSRLRPVPNAPAAEVIVLNDSGETSRSNSDNAQLGRRANEARPLVPRQPIAAETLGPHEPVVRAHNLLPYAPQPAHVSPLAFARQQAMPDPDVTILPGAPAQVAALRQEPANGTSSESSPHGEKVSKKSKKKKNNKRKAAELRAAERAVSPDIKPEPRSPSPLVSASYLRPNKRARPSERPQHELGYDGSRPLTEIVREDRLPGPSREIRPVIASDRVDDFYARPLSRSVGYRIEPAIYNDRRPEETIQYVRRVPSPSGYAVPYATGEVRSSMRPAYTAADPLYRDGYRDGRISTRPPLDRARSRSPLMYDVRSSEMMPTRPPTRIIRDQYGREYLEPPPPVVSRQSVAPAGRMAGEPEIVYERAPIRAPSRMAEYDTFERDGVVYRRVSPVPAPRRVITEPEYGAMDYRGYRQRDYSAHPAPAPPPPLGPEYSTFRVPERRLAEEIPAEYGRAASIRPASTIQPAGFRPASIRPMEQVRYEYGGVGGAQNYRPSMPPPRDYPPRDYAASVQPEVIRRGEPGAAALSMAHEYGGGSGGGGRVPEPAPPPPMMMMPRPREYSSVRPAAEQAEQQRYYPRPPVAQQDDEVAFIERPASRVVYDDGRREMYR